MASGYFRDNQISVEKYHTIYQMNLPEKHFSGNEIYNFWELVFVMDGELTTTANNNVYKLKKNSLILYEPAKFHTMGVNEGKFAEIFILSFTIRGDSVKKLKKVPYILEDTLRGDMYRIIDFCHQNALDKFVDSYLCEYHRSFRSQPLFLSKMCALTEFFLLSLCDTSQNVDTPVNTRETELFSAVSSTMLNNKREFYTIDILSEMHNVSPSKLKALIKKYSGESLHNYYIELKISQAIELFRKDFSVGEVSDELGFCNSNYFSTVFKSKTNKTPSQYISRLKNNLKSFK